MRPIFLLALGTLSSLGACQFYYFESPPKILAPSYVGTNTISFLLPAGQVNVSNMRMTPLTGRIEYPGDGAPPMPHTHDMQLNFDISSGSSTLPASATGTVAGMTNGGLGTYLTQIGTFDASGTTPLGAFMIRRNTATFSEGLSQVEDWGGGVYRVSGRLAIALELSTDNGATWTAANTHAQLTAVPEPATLVALGLGAVTLLRRRRSSA